MKILCSILMFLLTINANYGQILSEKSSPIFGKDVIIEDNAARSQCEVAITSAPNGWLYAMISSFVEERPYSSFYSSTDGGISWSLLFEDFAPGSYNKIFLRSQIICAGTEINDLHLYFCYTLKDTVFNIYESFIYKAKADPFSIDGEIVFPDTEEISSISMSRDPLSDWHNISFLYSFSDYKDFLFFRKSTDGGATSIKVQVTNSESNIFNVDLSYGSADQDNGKYFAAWEQKTNFSDPYGHIYISRTNESGSFIQPFCIDSLDANQNNKCRNPKICCNTGNYANNISNITEMIIYEHSNELTNTNTVSGFFNLQPENLNAFQSLSFINDGNNNIQPAVAFNDNDSTFNITWFDSTDLKLKCVSQNFNFLTPNAWTVISEGYNDETNVISPEPEIIINMINHKRVFAWKAVTSTNNNIGMIDSEYSTYTGLSTLNQDEDLYAFPNPCSDKIFFNLSHFSFRTSNIKVYNIFGKLVFNDQIDSSSQIFSIDMSNYDSGSYIYKIFINENLIIGKFIKM